MTQRQDPQTAVRVAAQLRELREAAGNPTLETLARRTGISKSVLSDAFAGKRMPTERTVTGLVRALDGDVGPILALRTPTPTATPPHAPMAGGPGHAKVVSRMNAVLMALVATVLGAALGSAGTLAAHRSAGDLPTTTVAARVDPQVTLPFAESPGARVTVRTGEDPAKTRCVDDAAVAAAETRTHDTLLEIIWSDACQAGWARITRYDGKARGNEVSASIFREIAPHGSDRQDTTEPGVQGAYTTLLVRPTAHTRVCATGQITLRGKHISLGEPICL